MSTAAFLKEFLGDFRTVAPHGSRVGGRAKYVEMIDEVKRGIRRLFPFEIDDLLTYDAPGERAMSTVELATRMQSNGARYVELVTKAVEFYLPDPSRPSEDGDRRGGGRGGGVSRTSEGEEGEEGEERSRSGSERGSSHTGMDAEEEDPTLVLFRSAVARARADLERSTAEAAGAAGAAAEMTPEELGFPSELGRRFEVRLVPQTAMASIPLRHVRAADLGHLIKVRAIVTRVSDVKPLLRVAGYHCSRCNADVFQTVRQRQFMPITTCPAPACAEAGDPGQLFLITRACKFQKYQELRVQELPEHVPVGHIPRTMSVVVRGELTREVLPGDVVDLFGVFTPAPYTGFRAMRAGLLADTFIEAHGLNKLKKGVDEEADQGVLDELDEAAEDPEIYSKLSSSIAPEIWGHEDIKKVLLLQLVGGVTREMADGMRIRGDINVCLVGDPGVAKSQLLKHITRVAPRAVYTTGKGSSGVGLTAAVLKDPVTGDMTLEGGALVLADNGICCIDEFDKMEEADRTAIHEVMEQQTVSIAKAGITTTLNARTAILAAANPLYGRYNERLHKDPTQNLLRNINLPAALLSRFDVVWVLRDEEDTDHDLALAKHVTFVHQKGQTPDTGGPAALSDRFIRAYISAARLVNPVVPPALADSIVERYVQLRAREAADARAASSTGRGVLTARQLLSILRMAQALARLEFRHEVDDKDVAEAMRLLRASKDAIYQEKEQVREDPKSRVFGILRELFTAGHIAVPYADALSRVAGAGFTEDQLLETVAEYEALDVLKLNASRTAIQLIGAQ